MGVELPAQNTTRRLSQPSLTLSSVQAATGGTRSVEHAAMLLRNHTPSCVGRAYDTSVHPGDYSWPPHSKSSIEAEMFRLPAT
jgi:hypothetical protein